MLADQLGLVMEWVGCPEKVEYGHVERTAARLLHWAAGVGLPATAAVLLGVLQSQAGSSAAAAEAAIRRVLPGGVDPLSLLQLSDSAVSAAALHRAARLGCLDGLSLLHKAVQVGACGEGYRRCCAGRLLLWLLWHIATEAPPHPLPAPPPVW